MPTLKQISCSIELGPSNVKLPEYGTIVRDGYVETFIAVPNASIPFTVHIKTKGYIGPGLAFFVFMDGEYQCNRNRTDLRIPAPDLEKKDYEAEFRLRQKEEKTGDGKFVAREWSFAKLDRVKADKAPNTRHAQYVENLGTIEVVVLRCHGDEVELPRLIPDRARDTNARPTTALQKKDPAVRAAKAEPKATSVREPADELGGLFGLFDGSSGFTLDDSALVFDDNPNFIPPMVHDSESPGWDAHAGMYIQSAGHRRRPTVEKLPRMQRGGSLRYSSHASAHQAEYARLEDFGDVSGMVECNPEALWAGEYRDKDWYSLLARFRAIFARRNTYPLHEDGLRALSDDIAEYDRMWDIFRQDDPEAFAKKTHDLPLPHEMEVELEYMKEDVVEKRFTEAYQRFDRSRPTDRDTRRLSNTLTDEPKPDVHPSEVSFSNTTDEAADGSAYQASPHHKPELSFDQLFLDGAGDTWNDPQDNWNDPRGRSRRKSGIPNAGGWQEVGGGTARHAQASGRQVYGQATTQHAGFHHTNTPQQVRFADAPGTPVQPVQAGGIFFGEIPTKHFFHEHSPNRADRDRSPGIVWGERNGPVATAEEYQRFLKWQEKFYGYTVDDLGRTVKPKKDDEEVEEPRERSLEEDYANGLRNPNFKMTLTEEELKELHGKLKPNNKKSQSSYSHGFGEGDGDANQWNDLWADPKPQQNKSPKQQGWVNDPVEEARLDDLCWGTPLPPVTSPPNPNLQPGYGTAALEAAGRKASTKQGHGQNTGIIWNPNYDWKNAPLLPKHDPAIVSIDTPMPRKVREKMEREQAEREKAEREKAEKAMKSYAGGRQRDAWKSDNIKPSKQSWAKQDASQGAGGWDQQHDQATGWDKKVRSKTESSKSSSNGGWGDQGKNDGWADQGKNDGWAAQDNNNNGWDQPKNDNNAGWDQPKKHNNDGWDQPKKDKNSQWDQPDNNRRAIPNANDWDNKSQSKSTSYRSGTTSQSKSKTESQTSDHASRTTSKTPSSANWASNAPRDARPRRTAEDVNSSDHIKSYWKAWNQAPADDDAMAIKKHDMRRDAYKYPAMPRPTVPSNEAKDKSHGVQAGKGADYSHKCRRPAYLDSMEEPYAVFTFKYRSARAVEKILNVKVDEADYKKIEEEIEFHKLMSMSKDELAKENAKLKMKKGRHDRHDHHDRHSPARSTTKTVKDANDGWGNGGGADAGNAAWGGGGSKKSSHRGGNRDDAKGDAGGWGADQGAPAANFGGW